MRVNAWPDIFLRRRTSASAGYRFTAVRDNSHGISAE
jgi:hypothetical protein